jgi:hypothetical protein
MAGLNYHGREQEEWRSPVLVPLPPYNNTISIPILQFSETIAVISTKWAL